MGFWLKQGTSCLSKSKYNYDRQCFVPSHQYVATSYTLHSIVMFVSAKQLTAYSVSQTIFQVRLFAVVCFSLTRLWLTGRSYFEHNSRTFSLIQGQSPFLLSARHRLPVMAWQNLVVFFCTTVGSRQFWFLGFGFWALSLSSRKKF